MSLLKPCGELHLSRLVAVKMDGRGDSPKGRRMLKRIAHRAERRAFDSATTIADLIHERGMRELDEAAERHAAYAGGAA